MTDMTIREEFDGMYNAWSKLVASLSLTLAQRQITDVNGIKVDLSPLPLPSVEDMASQIRDSLFENLERWLRRTEYEAYMRGRQDEEYRWVERFREQAAI